MGERIEVDHEATLAAVRREAEMWRTAKDRLAEQLTRAEAALDQAVEAGRLLLEVFDDWVIANEKLGFIGRESGRVQAARSRLDSLPPGTESQGDEA
jgi:hypothetical protein